MAVGPSVWLLKAIQAMDRLRLRALAARHPGFEVDPRVSSNFACARYSLAPGASLRIAAGAVTERLPRRLHFVLEPGARVEVGEGAWLRTEVGEVYVVAFEGARISIGPEAFLNGCYVSAKSAVTLGRRAWVGPGSRIYDADQHDFDAGRPELVEPVSIGDFVWISSDVTILRGVEIGAHAVVGTRSLVTKSVPEHTLAYGQPAQPRGTVGDRSGTR